MTTLSRLFTLTNGTVADATQVNAELDQLIAGHNAQETVGQANMATGATGQAAGVFHAEGNDGAYTIAASNVWTKVKLDVEVIDVSAWYDPALFRYTPLLAGYYRLSGLLTLGGAGIAAGDILVVAVVKNGTAIAATSRFVGQDVAVATSEAMMAGGSCVVQANGSTDYFELFAKQSNATAKGMNTVSNPRGSWFAGEFIGRS